MKTDIAFLQIPFYSRGGFNTPLLPAELLISAGTEKASFSVLPD